MFISTFNSYFQYFEKNRCLPETAKDNIDTQQRRAVLDTVERGYQAMLRLDNQAGDYNPLQGEVLLQTPDSLVSGCYKQQESERYLERLTIQANGYSNIQQVHWHAQGMDVIDYFSPATSPGTLLWYHLDFADPDNDFLQHRPVS